MYIAPPFISHRINQHSTSAPLPPPPPLTNEPPYPPPAVFIHLLLVARIRLSFLTTADKPTLKELGSLTKDAELKVQVMEKVSPHWDSLAIQLGFEFPRIEQIRSDNRTTLNCCQDMFSMWLTEGFRRPVTWKTLLDALGDSEYQVMADKLRKLLRD